MDVVFANVGTQKARGPARRRAIPVAGQVDFQRLLGPQAWGALPPAVQARFSVHPLGFRCRYDGRMEVRATAAGWLFAQVCRLIGTPLAPWTGTSVATGVDVWLDGAGGLVWDRTYAFAGHAPVLVSSRKLASADGGLLEVVRGGLGMALDVSVEEAAMHFRSAFYFVSLGGFRLRIPGLLTPGQAHVIHRDESGGRFRFTLSFHHPWLGETLFQDGVFTDPPAPSA